MFRTTGAAVLLCASSALGQQPNPKLTFEVASIKLAAPQDMVRLQGSVDGGQRFDGIAKVPDGATKEDARIMLQNLLADRFQLKLHKGSKDASIYELVVAKGGIKIREATGPAAAEGAGEPPPRGKDGLLRTPHGQLGIQAMVNGRMRLQGDVVTMARLADILGRALSRPVVDKTGISGVYDIKLDFSPKDMGPGPKGPAPGVDGGNPAEAPRDSNDYGPAIFTALQEQLGLKLESRKGPMDLLVVESVERCRPGISTCRIFVSERRGNASIITR